MKQNQIISISSWVNIFFSDLEPPTYPSNHPPIHPCTHTYTCMLNMPILIANGYPQLSAICKFLTCILACLAYVSMCACILHVWGTHPSTHTHPWGWQITKHGITLELTEIIWFCLKIYDLLRLSQVCSLG